MRKLIGSVLIILGFSLLTFLLIRKSAGHISYINIAGQHVVVDLATTPTTREQGLSGRAALPENHGMLFVFDTPGVYPFWMKDMNFPIDMIWISNDMKVVY